MVVIVIRSRPIISGLQASFRPVFRRAHPRLCREHANLARSLHGKPTMASPACQVAPLHLLLLGPLLLAAACGPPAPEESPSNPGDAARCVYEDENTDQAPERKVSIGHGPAEQFVAYQDDELIELTLGFQGGYMLMPVVKVEAFASDPTQACWMTHISNTIDGEGEYAPGVKTPLRMDRLGDAFYSGAVFDLLGFDQAELSGRTLTLGCEVSSKDAKGSTKVQLLLE